ncbi:MAG: dephospho-CoA kinase [Actinomycetes bacterium]
MLLVALTGGIGSGKSLAGQFFADLGAIVVDSDQLSREVIERGTPGFDEVLLRFGDEILTNGDIDRKKLAAIVFEDEESRIDLEEIIHPLVRKSFEKLVESASEGDIVINQIPLLVETDGAERFDRVITVISSLEKRKERLKLRGLPTYEIEKRLAAQASDDERIEISDYVVENNGTEDDLLREVEATFEALKRDIIE